MRELVSGQSQLLTTIERTGRRKSSSFLVAMQALRDPRSAGSRALGQLETARHWGREVAFDEDQSRMRIGCAQPNMATLRRMALRLLERDSTATLEAQPTANGLAGPQPASATS